MELLRNIQFLTDHLNWPSGVVPASPGHWRRVHHIGIRKLFIWTKFNELVSEDTTTSYNLFNAKKTDATLLSGQQVKNNLHNPNFVKRLPTATTRLDLNQNKVKAFKNLNIRRAFSLAINRQQLTKNVLQDGSVPLKGFVPSKMGKNPKTGEAFDQEAYVKDAVSYNLKQAKQLLAKGYKQTGPNNSTWHC